MGNCSACCGKTDTNEVTTEKSMNRGKTKDANGYMDGMD